MTDISGSPQEKLQALQEHFAHLLPGKVARCEGLWQALLDGGAPAETGVELARELHTLAGSAPSFGFGLLGKSSQRAEITLKTVLPHGREALERVRGDISDCIAEMRRLCGGRDEAEAEGRSGGLPAVTAAQSMGSRGTLIHILDNDPATGY